MQATSNPTPLIHQASPSNLQAGDAVPLRLQLLQRLLEASLSRCMQACLPVGTLLQEDTGVWWVDGWVG